MTTTIIILEVDHDKPIPDLLKLVEGRAYTLAGVKDTRARLIDPVTADENLAQSEIVTGLDARDWK